jgi:cyanobactin maturation PatA/PatG family protease
MSEEPPMSTAPFQDISDRSAPTAAVDAWSNPRESGGLNPSSCGCASCSGSSDRDRGLVFALGTIGYDLVNEARSDSIRAHMGGTDDPADPAKFLAYLKASPWEAASVNWIVQLDQTPIYAILPDGPFASQAYAFLVEFLADQAGKKSDLVSIPGKIKGRTTLRNGQVVDTVVPELRGMYNWKTKDLVDGVITKAKAAKAGPAAKADAPDVTEIGVTNFLHRVYYELRNLGVTSEERAINYASTNAIKVAEVYAGAAADGMELDAISVERSPICRPGSDCWDVKMMFFDPNKPAQAVRKSFRFTVDVSDVVPVMVGPVRSWSIR